MWNTLQNHSGAFRKNEEISAQTYHSDDFFDLKFSFSPCWRMCCPGSLSGEARGLSENIFPNIEDGRVFWVKRTFERAFVARKWKMRFLKPNTSGTPSDRFEYPFTYLNQGGTTQNGWATSILAPDIRHSKNDKNDKKWCENDLSKIHSESVPGGSWTFRTSKTFRRDPENIFPNIEDGRVFWVKRNMPRPFVAGKWKMRFYKPNRFGTSSDRFKYPFTYLNQGGTTQNS